MIGELKVRRSVQPQTGRWRDVRVEPRGATLLGLSFRPLQAEAFGLDVKSALQHLLDYPFQVIRLGAYWNRIEPKRGALNFDELDRHVDAAQDAGKQIILCVGPLKTFGYPEFFVPSHRLAHALPEGRVITTTAYADLLAAGRDFTSRIVERYRQKEAIIAWQVEHEAVDPLGLEHSWRLALDFVAAEVEAVRRADPSRPIMLNGFLPTSVLGGLQQWWRTRDQGDSLAAAIRLADIVGLDIYPRLGLVNVGPWTLYLDGSNGFYPRRALSAVLDGVRRRGRRLMVSESQAEPWETVTIPPGPSSGAMASCTPEDVISAYNAYMRRLRSAHLLAYLFWGAEYWLARARGGDASYLGAFARVLENA